MKYSLMRFLFICSTLPAITAAQNPTVASVDSVSSKASQDNHADGMSVDLPPPPPMSKDEQKNEDVNVSTESLTNNDDGATADPEVKIRRDKDKTIEEYRINGQLYMVKVTPEGMPPYYLMDEEGNGEMKQIDPNRRVIIPKWVLWRF